MTTEHDLTPYPDPSSFRMIGAIFWLGLLVLVIPQWFVHPVEFSPEEALMKTKPDITTSTTLAQSVVAETTLIQQEETPKKSELYIEKPLTTKAPVPDPNKVIALRQPVTLKEAQTDATGKLIVNHKEPARITAALAPPEVVADGKFWVQVASYTVESNALRYQDKFKQAGFPGRINVFVNKEGKKHYQIRVGPYRHADDAAVAKQLVDDKFKTNAMVLQR